MRRLELVGTESLLWIQNMKDLLSMLSQHSQQYDEVLTAIILILKQGS